MGLKKISSKSSSAASAAVREKVLYVEDEDTNWEVAELSLRGRYDLVRARNARECFELLKKHKYELVLMDIQLSGSELDGVQITNILKGLYKEEAPEFTSGVRLQGAPIVFMTAYAARYSKAELLEAGGDELVTKPVDFTRLALVVSRLMVKNAFAGSPTERRTEPRFEANTPVKVAKGERRGEERKESDLECHVEFDAHSIDSRLKDISKRGARLELRAEDKELQCERGTILSLSFMVQGQEVSGTAKVVWKSAMNISEVGVIFDGFSEANRSIIAQWVDSL
jgi:CheY-like chemotaxis protein